MKAFPLLGFAWAALAAVHAVLSFAAPRAAAVDPLLPPWARFTLLCTELAALALAVLVAGVPFALLAFLRSRAPANLRAVTSGVRCLLAVALLLAFAASWIAFRLSGQFLDGAGLRFCLDNLAPTVRYAAQMEPFHLFGLPWILLAAAVIACEGVPRWIGRLPARVLRGFGFAALSLAALAGVAAAAGGAAYGSADGAVVDPMTGISYKPSDLYRLRRDRNAGPVTHIAARLWSDPEPEIPEPAARFEIVRRPLQSMDAYLAGVNRSRRKPWNVVVVLVDSLRADQLQAGGCPRDVMPAVNALARESRFFTDCYTQASHTDYAAPCVFSSHYPLRAKDVYRYPKDPTYPRVMLYDVLKALGYRTALFSSQNEDWGQMSDYLQTGGLDVFFHSKTAGVSNDATDDRPAFAGTIDDSITMSAALQWIDAVPEAPFFLYLNLQNSHLPYEVPAGFPRRFGPKELDFKISVGTFPREKTDIVKDVYADSLAYVDSQLERLFERLRGRGLWENTVIVVTGDHGEAFYEHGSAAHANGIHEEVMRVPLVIRAPGLPPARDVRPAQLIDVPPSVLHLLGLGAHPSFQGENLLSETSSPERVRYLLSSTPWKTQMGLVSSGFKLIHDVESGSYVLYDLARDPGERTDATELHPELAQELRDRLSAWRAVQLQYYENALRHACEYPPILRD